MSSNTVAHAMWQMLASAGVRRVYGIVGDALDPTLAELPRTPEIEFIHVRNEEAGVLAANAEAYMTGLPVAVCGTAGPGATRMVNGLYDALHERVPIIAIAGDVLTPLIGSNTVEEVDPSVAFAACTLWRDRIETPAQAPAAFRTALETAVTLRGPVLLSLPGDVATEPFPGGEVVVAPNPAHPVVRPNDSDLATLAQMVNSSSRVMIFGGDGCREAHDEVVALAESICAPVGYSWRGKPHLEGENPFGVGMTGLLGWGGAYRGMREADLLLLLGTDLPFRDFYPSGVITAQVDLIAGHLGRRGPRLDLGLVGSVKDTLQALQPLITPKTDKTFLRDIMHHHQEGVHRLNHYVRKGPEMSPIRPEYLTSVISDAAREDAAFAIDTGTAFIWSARYIRMNGKRRVFASASWATIGNAMPNSIGLALADPDGQVIALCGDGGLSSLLGDLITIAERQLPVKLFLLNNGMLDFVNIEFQEGGLLPFGTKLWNPPSFADVATAIGIQAIRLEQPADVHDVVVRALSLPGPVLVDAVVDKHALAMPPHVAATMVKGFGFSQMKQVLHGNYSDVEENVVKNIGLM